MDKATIKYRITLKNLQAKLYYLWIIFIFISWRIPVGQLSNGKSIDIRIDDIVILLIELIFLFYLVLKGRFFLLGKIEKIFLVWILYKIFITILSFTQFVNISKIFYLLKELEFYSLIIIFPTFAKFVNFEKIYKIIIILGIINVGFILWQIFTGNLLGLSHGYYGISIIGEFSPLNSGLVLSFFSLFFLVYYRIFFFYIFFIFTILTFSRASIVGLLFATIYSKKILIPIIGTLMVLTIITYPYLVSLFKEFNRIIDIDYAISSILIRLIYDYIPALNLYLEHNALFILGMGKGIWGFGGFPIEAHNYFLRLLVEEGVIGLIFFIFLIYLILKKADKIQQGKLIKSIILLLLVASFFQDALACQKGLAIFVLTINILQKILLEQKDMMNKIYKL